MCARDASPDGSSPSRRRLVAVFGSQKTSPRHSRGRPADDTRGGVALSSQVLLLWGYGVGDQRYSSAIPEAPARVGPDLLGGRQAGRHCRPHMCMAACRLARKLLNAVLLSPRKSGPYRPCQTCASYREIAIFAFPETAPQVQQSNSRTASRCYWWQCTHHRREHARINKGACRIVASPKNGLGHRGGQLRTDPTHAPYSVSGAAM